MNHILSRAFACRHDMLIGLSIWNAFVAFPIHIGRERDTVEKNTSGEQLQVSEPSVGFGIRWLVAKLISHQTREGVERLMTKREKENRNREAMEVHVFLGHAAEHSKVIEYVYLFSFLSIGKICDMCDVNAECINNHCVCKQNYVGNGFHCTGNFQLVLPVHPFTSLLFYSLVGYYWSLHEFEIVF